MTRFWLFAPISAACLLGGCAVSPPPSAADQADLATCTSQADAAYDAQNYDSLSRTSQNGLRYSATPNQVFQAQQLGSLHERDDSIADCVRSGSGGAASAQAAIPGPPPAIPQIIGQ
jgi:hypothetical protein